MGFLCLYLFAGVSRHIWEVFIVMNFYGKTSYKNYTHLDLTTFINWKFIPVLCDDINDAISLLTLHFYVDVIQNKTDTILAYY